MGVAVSDPLPPVSIDKCPDISPQRPEARLILCWVPAEGDYSAYDIPGILRYPWVVPSLYLGVIGDCLSEIRRKFFFCCWCLGGDQGEPRAPPKLALVLPLGGAVEETQYHVLVCVVNGVPDEYIPEYTVVFNDN